MTEHEPVDPTPDDRAPDDDPIRRLLHDLPEVAPPDGFFDDLIRRRRRRARAIAAGGLAAAGLVGVLVVAHATGITGAAAPPVADLAARHESMAAADLELRAVRGQMPGDEVPAPFQAPARLAGMERSIAVLHPDDVVQVLYTRGGEVVSVFEQAGDLDDDAMTVEMIPIEVVDAEAWQTEEDGVVVVRRHDVVYVVVGDMEAAELAALVRDLPDARPMGLVRRVRDAMDDLVDAFSLR